MNDYFKKTADSLHHAYGIEGGESVALRLLEHFSNDLKISLQGNPDFFHERFETLTIEDSRRIKEIHSGKKFSETEPRVFLIKMDSATREAQNALLKVLEEPEPGNHFFIVTPTFDTLLPTLKSRLYLIRQETFNESFNKKGQEQGQDRISKKFNIPDFLKMNVGAKIAFVDALAASINDEKIPRSDAIDFLDVLEWYIYSKREDSTRNKHEKATFVVFESIARTRSYMQDRAASLKMLLEYVTLSLTLDV